MPDSLIQRASAKIRYYKRGVPWHGLILRVSIDAASRLGLRIEPFDLFLEGLGRAQAPLAPSGIEDCHAAFLLPGDMREVASMPGRESSEADLRARLESGQRCLGVKHGERIIAFTWCNLHACTIGEHRLFDLTDDEASLFDAYTVEPFRGRNLAPWMRYRCYEEMAKLGRHRCFSVTIVFNTPALRFKTKLGAEIIGRGVYIEVLGRSRFHFGAERP
jgi:hypothetical protein